MDRNGRSTLASFQRVQEFLAQHPLADEPDTLGEQARELEEVVRRLNVEAVAQESGARFVRVHVESQRKLRDALYAVHMQPIARVAREVFGITGMDRAFRLPKNGRGNQILLTAAAAMGSAAEKQKDVFVRHGLAPDFIDSLRAAAAALVEARSSRTESARRRVTATAAVDEQLRRGKKAIRLLDAILSPRLAKDPELLAAWRSAKRNPGSASSSDASADAALKVA